MKRGRPYIHDKVEVGKPRNLVYYGMVRSMASTKAAGMMENVAYG